MSNSKFIMAQKLCNVQKDLMGREIQDTNLDSLLPLIFESCQKENLTFWFNFLEDACVLNLRDIGSENLELNIRYAYLDAPETCDSLKYYKREVLINAFLILKEPVYLNLNGSDEASSEISSRKEEDEIHILEGGKPVPKHIRDAIETIKAKGIPVTPEAVMNHLPLGQMSTASRLECNRYLKEMGASK